MKRTYFLLSALLLLILANVLMMTYSSPLFGPTAEGFAASMEAKANGVDKKVKAGSDKLEKNGKKEGFANYSGQPGGAKDAYQAIGPFDGVRLQASKESSWRYTAPNEPLQGLFPKFEVGPDNLFMFKDNQCKSECCSASYSCNGSGCVCTTKEQRMLLQTRGNNASSYSDPGI